MYMDRIATLTAYIANGHRTLDDVCKHLIISTFKELHPKAMYLGRIESDGNLILKSSFGFEPAYISQWQRLPLTIDIPIVNAIRNDQSYVFSSKEEFFSNYPEVESLGIVNRDWESCIASPVQSLGAFFLVLNKTIKASKDFECFLKTVGNVLALQLQDFPKPIENKSHSDSIPKFSDQLSPRQELIRKLLAKGFTNPQVASEIGYSESLVRQETIAIYSKMRISGRRELIKIMENLEQE